MPATNVIEFPTEYLEAIDEVLMGASYAGRYNNGAAEFVNARQISIPDLDFGENPEPTTYSRFASESGVTVHRTVYTLDHDDEKVFYVDALDAIDEAAAEITKTVSEYQRVILAPWIDKYFFANAAGKAKTRANTTLTAANIKGEIRKARTQFNQAGLNDRVLYMSSTALALLEDATDRQWSNDTTIIDTVGNYDGFQIFEVPDELLQADFTALAGGQRTMQYIIKRAANYLFAPGTHTKGDGWLCQMRWVFGNIVRYNKTAGLYTNKPAATAPQKAVGTRNSAAASGDGE